MYLDPNEMFKQFFDALITVIKILFNVIVSEPEYIAILTLFVLMLFVKIAISR